MTEAGALRRLETLCARSEHSEGELLDKMRRWGLSDEEQARIIRNGSSVKESSGRPGVRSTWWARC